MGSYYTLFCKFNISIFIAVLLYVCLFIYYVFRIIYHHILLPNSLFRDIMVSNHMLLHIYLEHPSNFFHVSVTIFLRSYPKDRTAGSKDA